jgi:hypothetical protein
VVIGIINRRWSIACTFFVLHVAVGSFIIGCMSHWASEHQHVASPYGSYAPGNEGGIHASMMTAPKGSRG